MIAVASWPLILCGLALVRIGGSSALARPTLLPEDARFTGTTSAAIRATAPGLARWLRRVFRVFGGHIVATGVVVVYLAHTGLRAGDGEALVHVLLDSISKRPLLLCADLGGSRPRSRGGGPLRSQIRTAGRGGASYLPAPDARRPVPGGR